MLPPARNAIDRRHHTPAYWAVEAVGLSPVRLIVTLFAHCCSHQRSKPPFVRAHEIQHPYELKDINPHIRLQVLGHSGTTTLGWVPTFPMEVCDRPYTGLVSERTRLDWHFCSFLIIPFLSMFFPPLLFALHAACRD
ncbi:hypothetical protein MAPG_05850 [Magnaporthiopsis poae ATCC 64411]|uniref:Uncharacterized protein n=1 Tax=Magnaporthiopsis poae (strain ATCC 64411 / 73-15) TaxID=644358 RepID=A0A0C4E0H7_MAGP6|nr:hypothetical protein MAPG_05850 [Magnaporthiopsis poae ATCC 64411]